jgi:endogenous inhibitor of DNA gyrase (YacG/DUF329 family)
MKCIECGDEIPAQRIGRPRKFCSSDCSRAWNNDSKRLARQIESARIERDEALGRFGWSTGDVYRLRAQALRAELIKLEEDRAVRRAGVKVEVFE